jgi:hypothetical protein
MRAAVRVLDSRRVKTFERQHESDEKRVTPPGQFVSDQHEADCSRFLAEVMELARRRREAGLGRDR